MAAPVRNILDQPRIIASAVNTTVRENNKFLPYPSFLFKGRDCGNYVTNLCFPLQVFKLFTIFKKKKLCTKVVGCTDRWRYDQVRLHFVICQVAFPLTAFSSFDLKTIVELQERSLCDVNTAVTKDTGHCNKLTGSLL
jgi:hypothetical protein